MVLNTSGAAAVTRAETLPMQIARTLSERIVSGQLVAGQKILQDVVAAEFGASHVPVREAFRQLESSGLLVSLPRQGVRVATLTVNAVDEINCMRAALEVLALRHAVPLTTEADLRAARQALQDGNAATDMPSWEDANRRFHRALYQPCAMPRLLSTIDDLHQARARYMLATARFIDWDPDSHSEHEDIVQAVHQQHTEHACALLQAHISGAGHLLIAATRKLTEPGAPTGG